MYGHPYLLYLYVQRHQKELFEQAEQARLIKSARQKQSRGTGILKWARARWFENKPESRKPREQLRVSGQCCAEAES